MLTVRQTHHTESTDRVVQGDTVVRDGEVVHVFGPNIGTPLHTFDRQDGDVFVMNDKGSTVATYRRVVVVTRADDGIPTADDLASLKPERDINDGPFPVY